MSGLVLGTAGYSREQNRQKISCPQEAYFLSGVVLGDKQWENKLVSYKTALET